MDGQNLQVIQKNLNLRMVKEANIIVPKTSFLPMYSTPIRFLKYVKSEGWHGSMI